jgi:hypothetical protein
MDPQVFEEVLIFAGTMAAMGCLTGIIITFLKHRAPRLKSGEVTAGLDAIGERLGRLETAVDATALEVERIAEGQRFTTRLLAESKGVPQFPDLQRGGSQTPH